MTQGNGRQQAAEGGRASAPRRPIDMVHLERQALGDPGIGVEILRMFDEIVAVHFCRLEQAVERSDMLHHAHTIKAASAGVGAWALAEHAGEMEREIAAGGERDPERVADLEMAIAEVHAFIVGEIARDTERWATLH
jgi:HPt (histidine-containing phosphotransfer) domain-containing protein